MATYTTNYNLEKPEASDPFEDFRESYNDNLDIIDANLGGGGGGGDVMDVEVNGVSVVDGNKVAKITSYKEVTQAQYDALPASKLTDGIAYFIKDGGGSGSGGSFLLVISAETGETVTATKDGTTLTATEVSTGVYEIEVTSAGTWTLSDGTNTETVDVGVYTATLSSIPEGSTVTPTDDVSIWLACAGRSENYTTVGEVLADSTCLLALLSDNNSNDYLVRSTTWASTITADSSAMSYIGLNNYCSNTLLSDSTWCNAICNSAYFESVLNAKVPTMTSESQDGYVISESSAYGSALGYKAFDNIYPTTEGQATDRSDWASNNIATNQWVAVKFPSVVCAKKFVFHFDFLNSGTKQRTVKNYKVQASNDGVTWTDIGSSRLMPNLISSSIIMPESVDTYLHYRIFAIDNYGGSLISICEWQFYGRKDI